MKKNEKVFTISAIIEYSGGKLAKKEVTTTFRESKVKKAIKAYAQFVNQTVKENKKMPVEKMEFTFSNEEGVLGKATISEEDMKK